MDKTLSNEQLRDIELQHAEDDEDIADLLSFVRHLKRKLGNAQKHIDEQRKHLNAIRLKYANIRFEDWEAEQMHDPEFRAAAEELEPAYQVARLRIVKNAKAAKDATEQDGQHGQGGQVNQSDVVIDAKTGEIIETDEAWERHRRIVELRNLAEDTFLQLGEELYWFKKRRHFKAVGHPTFESYVADPDVDIARPTAFRLIGVYLTYCEKLKVSPGILLAPGYRKLYMMHKYMTTANVEEWVAAAATVSRSDLKLLLENAFGKEPPPLPPGQFRVIYADPPWQYSNVGLGGSAEKHYSTMSTDVLAELEIGVRAAGDAVLFLWSTNSHISDALRIIKAWDFEYKANLVWIKDKPSYGKLAFYFRGQHELLMLAIRGSMPPQVDPLPVSILAVPKREHSRKPEEVYEIIETMYGGPYLELFARGVPRTGWTTWGDEVE